LVSYFYKGLTPRVGKWWNWCAMKLLKIKTLMKQWST
jgi:hypothetical protein